MFNMTREELAETLTEHGYLIANRGGLLGIYTEDSQLVAEFHVNDDVVMRGAYLPAWGAWVRPAEIDDVIEYLCSEAILRRVDEEFLVALDDEEFLKALDDEDAGEDY